MADEREFDVIVLGAGPAGEVAAGRLAGEGFSVALVEEHLVGGECAYYACMPSKALLRSGQALTEVERVPGAREACADELDVAAVLRRRDEVIHDLHDDGQLPWLEKRGIALVRGHGRLAGERRVQVGGALIRALRAVIVAVGSAAQLPPIPGLREAAPWTNREVTTAHHIPSRLVVLGGGPVGCEMAQAYAMLGADVTVIEAAERLLAREEHFAGEQVAAALERLGGRVVLGADAKSIERDGEGGEVTVTLADGMRVVGDELLVAVGRRARTDDLGLETVGVAADGAIEVDDQMRVGGRDWLFAIGDANGRALLTHVGKYQARIAGEVIAGRRPPAVRDGGLSPRVTFTEPQVAAVGATSEQAERAGVETIVVDHATAAVAGASFHGRDADGTARLVIDARRGVVVGATFTGPDIAEMLHSATIAVAAEVPIERLWEAIPAFPTRSEVWLRLLEKHEQEVRAKPAGARQHRRVA